MKMCLWEHRKRLEGFRFLQLKPLLLYFYQGRDRDRRERRHRDEVNVNNYLFFICSSWAVRSSTGALGALISAQCRHLPYSFLLFTHIAKSIYTPWRYPLCQVMSASYQCNTAMSGNECSRQDCLLFVLMVECAILQDKERSRRREDDSKDRRRHGDKDGERHRDRDDEKRRRHRDKEEGDDDERRRRHRDRNGDDTEKTSRRHRDDRVSSFKIFIEVPFSSAVNYPTK